jgi:hypothetical protein
MRGLKEQSVSFWMISPEDMDIFQNTELFFLILRGGRGPKLQ